MSVTPKLLGAFFLVATGIRAAFVVLTGALATAAVGTLQLRTWGYLLAVGIFILNAISETARLASGGYFEGGFGIVVSALILFWLTRTQVRALFSE